jgi:hypothetical protein
MTFKDGTTLNAVIKLVLKQTSNISKKNIMEVSLFSQHLVSFEQFASCVAGQNGGYC